MTIEEINAKKLIVAILRDYHRNTMLNVSTKKIEIAVEDARLRAAKAESDKYDDIGFGFGLSEDLLNSLKKRLEVLEKTEQEADLAVQIACERFIEETAHE